MNIYFLLRFFDYFFGTNIGSTYICIVFMVLDLRLKKIGCRETINFCFMATVETSYLVLRSLQKAAYKYKIVQPEKIGLDNFVWKNPEFRIFCRSVKALCRLIKRVSDRAREHLL